MTKALQTRVDDDVHERFKLWAEEEYGGIAAALRDFAEKAPNGESVHADTTNDDIMTALDDLRDDINSRSFTTSSSSSSNPDLESAMREQYEPNMDAECLPDDVTPVADDATCLSKDALNAVVEIWGDADDVSDVPAINPRHIDLDHRPQGNDAPIALGLALIRNVHPHVVKHHEIRDVLSDDDCLGYTEQYVRDHEYADMIASELPDDPSYDESARYLVSKKSRQNVADRYRETMLDRMSEAKAATSKDEWEDHKSTACKKAMKVREVMGEDAAPSTSDMLDEMGAVAEVNIRRSIVDDARDMVDDARDRVDDLSSVSTPSEVRDVADDIRDMVDDARDRVDDAYEYQVGGAHFVNHCFEVDDDLDMADLDDVEQDASDIEAEIEEIESEIESVVERECERAAGDVEDVAEYRARGLEMLVDAALDDTRAAKVQPTQKAVLEYERMVSRYEDVDDELGVNDALNALGSKTPVATQMDYENAAG